MPRVHFVGCGPGDPELITIKARRLVRDADVLVYSGSLIPGEILSLAGKARMHDASGLVREEITELLLEGARSGGLVVRLHDGDPAIYGAIREQIDALAGQGVESEVVPGVTSFLAAAAALGTQLTLPGVTQTIILTRAAKRTAVPEGTARLASHGATMVFYLSAHLLRDIVRDALEGGYAETTPAAVVYMASRKEQRIVRGTLADIAEKASGITRTAIVVIGEALDPAGYEHSRLYDASFSHGYRSKRSDGAPEPRGRKG
ncbi:Cobalt-precorrin-4 C(11)-methyltransferase [Nitrosopumilaceae archaeon]|nr:precorrin-4 C(11)-methyltransferase [Nitrosopumilus sp.]CAI9832544.1 Cobalt-precorrin-4 C(11)-methyltransferase [Nitrosopumilaceae archaeon]MDA7944473.1 precorrin-4 C(11)-methyltransferase [Nitrosopumilus sp.]MDA7954225.1 precorrin-4 C(11)-methyltransferase [Nitrosopumilus sp.]MDA7973179.1 precorrin-4 C(11)-methyltransferase [Nitrosopumilus sp.]